MITKREQEERREIMQNALASQRLEGLEPDAKAIADSEKWVRGEVEIRDLIEDFTARVKRGEVRG
jgi:cytochrome P450